MTTAPNASSGNWSSGSAGRTPASADPAGRFQELLADSLGPSGSTVTWRTRPLAVAISRAAIACDWTHDGRAPLLLMAACDGGGDAARPVQPPTTDPGTTPTALADGVVVGRLLMVGGPAFTEPQAVGGTIEAIVDMDASGRPVAVSTADQLGQFRVSLPPGSFHLSGRSPMFGGNRLQCNAIGSVAVVAGASTETDVHCQRR